MITRVTSRVLVSKIYSTISANQKRVRVQCIIIGASGSHEITITITITIITMTMTMTIKMTIKMTITITPR